jgi:hypothetical protein
MSIVQSAFKIQNQKSYGNVEKMYIHFYTIPVETATSNELYIYWYALAEQNIDLFNDFHTLFKKCKQYTYASYTGELFSINSLQQFKENLILLGVKDLANPIKISKVNLQDGTSIDMNLHTINNVPHFNDMFDICFQNYDFHQSFSDINDIIEESNEIKPIICVENCTTPERIYLPQVELKCIAYKIVKTSVDNETLNGWFNTLVKNKQYNSVLTILDSLCNFNTDLEVSNTVENDFDDGVSINESVAPTKISKTDWIKLFCDLYLEEDKTTDILLSDVYQEYITASSWTDTPTVTMAIFIKQLRALNKYTIKRRSKGMMLIGYTSLVSAQADFKKKSLTGSLTNRALFRYRHPREVRKIVKQNEDKVILIGHKYAREVAFILYNINIILNYQTVNQFCSIPQLVSEIDKIAKYIDKQFDPEEIKSESERGDIFYNFRKTADECLIYFPFNKKYCDMSYNNNNNTDLLTTKSFIENTHILKNNDDLTYYEFGNFRNNIEGTDLSWTDSFGITPKSLIGDITSTRAGTTINRVFKTAKPVCNQQLRKDPQEPGICASIAGIDSFTT